MSYERFMRDRKTPITPIYDYPNMVEGSLPSPGGVEYPEKDALCRTLEEMVKDEKKGFQEYVALARTLARFEDPLGENTVLHRSFLAATARDEQKHEGLLLEIIVALKCRPPRARNGSWSKVGRR